MGNLLKLITKLFGKNALSKTLGTRTNVIKLPSNEKKRLIKNDLDIEAGSDIAIQKVLKEAEELIAEVPKMNDQERLIFEGNLRRLDNRLNPPSAEVISIGTKQPVSREGIKQLVEEAGQKSPPGSLMGDLESRLNQLRASGKKLEDIAKESPSVQFEKMLQDPYRPGGPLDSKTGIVRTAAREILEKNLKAGKIDIPDEAAKDAILKSYQGGVDPIDVLRQRYGEGILEQLDDVADELNQARDYKDIQKILEREKLFDAPPKKEYGYDEGVYSDEEMRKILQEAEEPEDFATGGRVGLRYGGDTMGGKNDKSKSSPGPDRSHVSDRQERSHQRAVAEAQMVNKINEAKAKESPIKSWSKHANFTNQLKNYFKGIPNYHQLGGYDFMSRFPNTPKTLAKGLGYGYQGITEGIKSIMNPNYSFEDAMARAKEEARLNALGVEAYGDPTNAISKQYASLDSNLTNPTYTGFGFAEGGRAGFQKGTSKIFDQLEMDVPYPYGHKDGILSLSYPRANYHEGGEVAYDASNVDIYGSSAIGYNDRPRIIDNNRPPGGYEAVGGPYIPQLGPGKPGGVAVPHIIDNNRPPGGYLAVPADGPIRPGGKPLPTDPFFGRNPLEPPKSENSPIDTKSILQDYRNSDFFSRAGTADVRSFTFGGEEMSGSSTYISGLKNYLDSIGKSDLFGGYNNIQAPLGSSPTNNYTNNIQRGMSPIAATMYADGGRVSFAVGGIKKIAQIINSIKKLDPMDAMKEVNEVVAKRGKYKNLSDEEVQKIFDDTNDHIFEREVKPKETDVNFDDDMGEATPMSEIETVEAMGAPITAKTLQLMEKYPGLNLEVARKIASDPDPQRQAEVIAVIDQAFEMNKKGMSMDEIVDVFSKNTDRTKQARGGLAYLMGL